MNIRVYRRLFAAFLLVSVKCHGCELATPRLNVKVENTAESTVITAREKGSNTPVVFRLDWIHGAENPQNFRTETNEKKSLISTYLQGRTTLTRTVLASEKDDCIFIHVHADQPGPVHFTANFVSEKPIKVHDRRQLILSGKESHAHAWIIPYESDVSDDGKTITLAGEGEALIILNLTSAPGAPPISGTLSLLGEKYDPGHTPPSPYVIWEGVMENEGQSE